MRTLFYAGLALLLYWGHRRESVTLSAVVIGVTLADYLTWLAFAIVEMPDYLAEGAWDAVGNVAATVAIFHYGGVNVPRDPDAVFPGFMSFLVVLLVKGGYYGAKYLTREE